MPVRVLHCYADYKWTGPSEPVVQLCAQLTERGWPSDLACAGAPPGQPNELAERARRAGVTTHDVLAPSGTLRPLRFFSDRAALRRLASDSDYGIIHCHGSWDHLVAGWTRGALNSSGMAVVRTEHAGREFYGDYLGRRYFGPRMIDHLIVLSDRYAVQAVSRLGLAPGTVTAVRGAVDTAEFRPADAPAGARQRLGFGPEDVIVGVVSRVQPHRRFEVLLAAAGMVQRRDPRVKIAVCGRGTRRRALLDRPVRQMGLSDTVFPLGYRRADYKEVLSAFDAGLMLVPGSDGSCRAALQMAAMGNPLIVAQRGVLPDIVRDGETGIVVTDTAANVADALVSLAQDGERRREWGRAARERMCRHFTLERQAEAVIGVYRAFTARPGR